ncbi:SUKH-4 family immunity protein [Streptomyces nigra]|uniref:SUKH-4 family immunity protein n=1 Tax=Streptomyces nigra TaxID=1827580 RepID=UPI0038262F74
MDVVGFGGGAAVLQDVHRRISGSVLVDATGLDAEGVFRDALRAVGVSEDEARPYAWDSAVFEHGTGKLVLIAHAGRAGLTRRSAQPLLVRDHAVPTLALPWKVRWTHWRPPGGYDPGYLKPGPVGSLFDVRWHDRPAIASTAYAKAMNVWDAETGDHLAGPWYGETLPDKATTALTWPTAPSQAPPTTRKELRALASTEEGPDDELLPTLLRTGQLTVLAGPGGLFAVEGTAPAPLPGAPLLGTKTAAGPALLTDATTTTAADLPQLFPDAPALRTPPESLPPGLTDETARRVLTETGLPVMQEKGIRLEPDYDKFLWELSWTEGLQPPAETGPFFQIGLWSGAELVIDGPTGHILRMPRSTDEGGLDGYLVATDLDRFLAMVTWWITGRRILNTIENRDEEHLFRQHIEDAVSIIDSAGAAAQIWTYALHND